MSGHRVEPDPNVEYFRAMDEYWRQVASSDGFDVEGLKPPDPNRRPPPGIGGMMSITVPQEGWSYPYCDLVSLYARFGLHRFNMKEGTKWELDKIIKFNVRTPSLTSIFFITLAAHECCRRSRRRRRRRRRTRSRTKIFQVRVDEIMSGSRRLDLVCSIARVKGDRDEPTNLPISHSVHVPRDYGMPDWPPNDDDLQGFYLVEGSELVDTHWIRLYLELALHHAQSVTPDLSNLMILKAVIDADDKEAPLNAKDSILYIVFKGVVVRGVDEDVERKAVIKTDFNEETGFLSIKGVVCSGPEDLLRKCSVKRPRAAAV